jgi:GTP-binding protein
MKATYLKAASKKSDYPSPDFPEIALTGRSNVGKSSFLNRLTQQKGLARVSKTPGRTQLIHFFDTDQGFRLVDLPGYGFAKVPEAVRRAWKPMIEDYLQGRDNLALVICLVDIRHAASAEDVDLKAWLDGLGLRTCLVATKSDKLSRNQANQRLKELRQQFGVKDGVLAYSSVTGEGRKEVLQLISSCSRQS